MYEKFVEQLKEILEMENTEIQTDDKFREYEKWDSLVALSVIAMMDDEFGVVISAEDFRKLITVGDLIDAVKKRMQ
jgi:acyl carrier protein